MTYGSSEWSPWVKNEEESIKAIEEAYELGSELLSYLIIS